MIFLNRVYFRGRQSLRYLPSPPPDPSTSFKFKYVFNEIYVNIIVRTIQFGTIRLLCKPRCRLLSGSIVRFLNIRLSAYKHKFITRRYSFFTSNITRVRNVHGSERTIPFRGLQYRSDYNDCRLSFYEYL